MFPFIKGLGYFIRPDITLVIICESLEDGYSIIVDFDFGHSFFVLIKYDDYRQLLLWRQRLFVSKDVNTLININKLGKLR